MLRKAAQSGTPHLASPAPGQFQGSQASAADRGTFTQFFGAGLQPGGQVPPPGPMPGPVRPAPSGATGMFGAAGAGPVPAGPSAASGPGDYTRLFGTPPVAPSYDQAPPSQPAFTSAGAPQSKQAQPSARPAKPSMLPLIIVGIALLVVVGALVVYFLLRR